VSFTCPIGHQSETGDYCDQCGARIEGAAEPAASAPSAGPAPAPAAASSAPPAAPSAPPAAHEGAATAVGEGDEVCPVCQTPRVGDDRFCENCGHDFTTPPKTAGDPSHPAAWEATVTADRVYFDRMAPEGVAFPLHCPPRSFLLGGGEIRIGRHSSSRGIQPEVDLSGAPEDSAISHLHCLLIEQPDGTYSLVDPGSTNGTTLNDDETPLAANVATAVADGDRIHLGAWTTITLHRRSVAAGAGTLAS
jgi:hypothetical protein